MKGIGANISGTKSKVEEQMNAAKEKSAKIRENNEKLRESPRGSPREKVEQMRNSLFRGSGGTSSKGMVNMFSRLGINNGPLSKESSNAISAALRELSEQEKDDSWNTYLEKIPIWAEQPLQAFEYEVGVTFTKADEEFGNKVTKDLQDLGLKCTKDPDHMSNTRAFVLIYSEDAASDETVLRLLTRAAERFNDGNTNIFPVVHPKCVTTVLNHIPHTLAYSLSNTTFVNMIPSPSLATNAQFVRSYYEKKLGVLKSRLEGYVRHKPKWDISGVWLLRVVLKTSGSTVYELQEFTAFLQHKDAKTIIGTTVNGIKIEGTLDGNSLKLQFTHEGSWTQADEQWKNENFIFIAQINAGLKVQGTKFEGSYVDCFGGVQRGGTVSAILEEECLSGYYKFTVDKKEKQVSLIQRGDRLFGDVSGMHGIMFSGVIAQDLAFWAFSVGDKSGSYNGTVKDEYNGNKKQSSISGNAYIKHGSEFMLHSFKATQMDPPSASSIKNPMGLNGDYFSKTYERLELTKHNSMARMNSMKQRSRVQVANMAKKNPNMQRVMSKAKMESVFKFEAYDKQKELEEAYGKTFSIDTTPYVPLQDDEFGVFIGSAEDCIEQAKALQENLEKTGIPRVTLDLTNYQKARTFIILLSAGTKNNPDLVQATFKTAASNKPIFNVGMADFFEIFDENKWTDKEALRNLRDALARLNQTDASTLDPNNNNFNALVRRIKGHVESPNYKVEGLWYIHSPEFPADDFMMFVKQDGETLEVNEFNGDQWNGMVKDDDFVLRKLGSDDQYVASIHAKLKEKGSAFIGRYKGESGNDYNVLGTLETDGISGLWEVENQPITLGIVQKGGGRLLIQHGPNLYPGVMSGNYAIFQMDKNENDKATYEAAVRNSKTGQVMSGNFYTDKSETGSFVAKKTFVEQRDEGPTYDVMISYRSTDAIFINLLQHVLEEVGITCWRDRRMEVGTNWSEDITRAVRSSRCVICCISDNYIKSSLCTKEILMAHDMGKIIIPLVLPDTEAKEFEFLRMVRVPYPSAHPPHVVAREIVKTTWFDFRPFSDGPDPIDGEQFEERYPIVTYLKAQLNNIKRKGCLWDLDGTWQFDFHQDKATNTISLDIFEGNITFDHTKYSLSGAGVIKGEGFKETNVIVDGARLENSVLSFSLKFPIDPSKGSVKENWKEGVMFLRVMLGVNGKSLAGKFSALKVGPWCNQNGIVTGKLVVEKNSPKI